MSRKRVSGRSQRFRDNEATNKAIFENTRALTEGPTRRKNWSRHDLKTIKPLTDTQENMFHAWMSGKHILGHGSAGTGKTYIAWYLALNEMLRPDSEFERIVIIRSVVPTREIGHLPGTIEEKTAIYELPYKDMVGEFLGRKNSYDDMKEAGKIHFCTTSFIRGLTWDNSIIIVDEGQNMTFHEINSIMTRLGTNSRLLFVGDLPQSDLRGKHKEPTGMDKLLSIGETMNAFSIIHFTQRDIVRSEFVKAWIIASEEFENQ